MTDQLEVFATALAGCEKLRTLFPEDRSLPMVIQQLQAWQNGQAFYSTDAVSDRQRRNIDRHIRPLCEEVANLVHQAELQAISR